MSVYKHILVGLDLSEESHLILAKASQLAELHSAKLSVIHVIEPLTFAYAGDLPIDLSDTQQVLQQHAQDTLDELAKNCNQAIEVCEVLIGPTAHEMRQKAEDLQADLLLVGSHGRHGFALILGSTASDIIHGAPCDVLAVRIH